MKPIATRKPMKRKPTRRLRGMRKRCQWLNPSGSGTVQKTCALRSASCTRDERQPARGSTKRADHPQEYPNTSTGPSFCTELDASLEAGKTRMAVLQLVGSML